jgi:hypothetical protein
MMRMLPISCVMLVLSASAALGGGLNISWGPECASDALIVNRNFTCDTNNGYTAMVVSFVPWASHEALIAVDAVIDGQVAHGNAVIPDWWQFKNTGACRINALSANATNSGQAVYCQDPWSGQGTVTITYYGDPVCVGTPTPPVQGNRARIKVSCVVPEAFASNVWVDTEYFLLNVVIKHTATVGAGSCAGCMVPMCWLLNSITAGYLDAGVYRSETIAEPILNNVVQWHYGTACISPVATQNKTWGQIKSLYR